MSNKKEKLSTQKEIKDFEKDIVKTKKQKEPKECQHRFKKGYVLGNYKKCLKCGFETDNPFITDPTPQPCEETRKEVIKILRSFFVDSGRTGKVETWGVPERAEKIMSLLSSKVKEAEERGYKRGVKETMDSCRKTTELIIKGKLK